MDKKPYETPSIEQLGSIADVTLAKGQFGTVDGYYLNPGNGQITGTNVPGYTVLGS